VFTRGEKIPDTTNNVAEYEGLLQGLILSVKEGVKKLIVRSDSQLLVRQLEGKYKVKATHLIPLHEKARTLSKNFEMIRFEHVPREENKLADRLANEALDGK
jgi:ribonuclease HI